MYVNMAYQCNLTQIKAVNSEKKKQQETFNSPAPIILIKGLLLARCVIKKNVKVVYCKEVPCSQ